MCKVPGRANICVHCLVKFYDHATTHGEFYNETLRGGKYNKFGMKGDLGVWWVGGKGIGGGGGWKEKVEGRKSVLFLTQSLRHLFIVSRICKVLAPIPRKLYIVSIYLYFILAISLQLSSIVTFMK